MQAGSVIWHDLATIVAHAELYHLPSYMRALADLEAKYLHAAMVGIVAVSAEHDQNI